MRAPVLGVIKVETLLQVNGELKPKQSTIVLYW